MVERPLPYCGIHLHREYALCVEKSRPQPSLQRNYPLAGSRTALDRGRDGNGTVRGMPGAQALVQVLSPVRHLLVVFDGKGVVQVQLVEERHLVRALDVRCLLRCVVLGHPAMVALRFLLQCSVKGIERGSRHLDGDESFVLENIIPYFL